METIISTRYCYEAHNKADDVWENGSYSTLCNDINVDIKTIEFSDSNWNSEKEYFINFLESELRKYEKRYKTTVEAVAMVGKVGLWNSSPTGGKIIEVDALEEIFNMNVDDIEIKADSKTGELFIYGHHHDGSHCMGLHFITESKCIKAGFSPFEYSVNDIINYNSLEMIDYLYNNFSSLKLTKTNEYFNIWSKEVA